MSTLKFHNFFAIGSILKFFDVPESSGSLLSHNRIYFPGRFHESSSNLGSDFLDFAVDQILLDFCVLISKCVVILISIFRYEKLNIFHIGFVFRIRLFLLKGYSRAGTLWRISGHLPKYRYFVRTSISLFWPSGSVAFILRVHGCTEERT